MSKSVRKALGTTARVVICLAALLIVLRGVTIHDRVYLSDGTAIDGYADEVNSAFAVTLSNGEVRRLSREEVAVDSAGELRISYGLVSAWNRSAKGLLLLAVLLHFPVGFLQGVRFRYLLAAQKIALSYWNCVKLAFAGNFLNFAAPLGSNAGDVFKAYFVTLHTAHKTEAVTTVILDRVIGLGTLVLVVALITVLSPPGSRLAPLRAYILTMLAIGVVVVAVYLTPWTERILRSSFLQRRLPGFEHFRRIDQAARTLARRPWIVFAAVLTTAALQAMAMGAYFIVAVALGLRADLSNVFEYYAYFATGAVIQALPGPPQGMGTVELAYRYFLAPFGSPSQIICFAFAARLVVLACALPGAIVAMTGSYRPKAVDADQAASLSESELSLADTRGRAN